MKNKEDITNMISDLKNITNRDFSYDEEKIVIEYNTRADLFSNKLIVFLSIVGGFLASLFLLLYLFISIPNNSARNILIGVGFSFIIITYFINKKLKGIVEYTFIIALYLLGIFLIGFQSYQDLSLNIVATILIIISVISTVLIRNFILIFINVLIINFSIFLIIEKDLILLLLQSILLTISLILLVQKEAELLTEKFFFNQNYNAVLLAIIISFLAFIYWQSKFAVFLNEGDMVFVYLNSIAPIFGILFVQYSLFKKIHFSSLNLQILSYILVAIVLIATIPFPLIPAAILLIFLSFSINHVTGLVIGISTLIYAIIQYYYDLNMTLLNKSILLMASGILLLLMYFFASKNRILKNGKE